MFATGETMGLALWIIDDSCLVLFTFDQKTLKDLSGLPSAQVSTILKCYLFSQMHMS